MIHYCSYEQLADIFSLKSQMFKDRASQFKNRLNWNVTVDEHGQERDGYDRPGTLYVILANDDGRHLASLRLIPTWKGTMIHDHFSDFDPTKQFVHPTIFECSRLCLGADVNISKQLPTLLTAATYAMKFATISHFIGLIDPTVARLYRRLPGAPQVISSRAGEHGKVLFGLWTYDEGDFLRLRNRSSLHHLTHHLAASQADVLLDVKNRIHSKLIQRGLNTSVSFG